MISRKLNENNDVFFARGRSAMVIDADEVTQHIATRLKFYLEEWFLDLTAGTPWFQMVFVKPADIVEIEAMLKQRILETDGVNELLSFDLNYTATGDGLINPRTLSVTFSCNTIYDVEIGGTVNV